MIFNDDIRRRDPVSDVRTLLADIVVLSNPAAVEAIDHFYRVQVLPMHQSKVLVTENTLA